MRRFAALFPGQGSQYVGMGSDLAQGSAPAAVFAEANRVLGTDVLAMAGQLTEEELARPENNHLAVYTQSVAAWEDFKAHHPTWSPHYFAGHSLGEYSALTAAGVLPLADGLKLVQRRGELLAEAAEKSPGHTIVIMGEALDRVPVWCEELVEG
ncbi:MAG: acyltransferase domain-containing protein, partial [Bacteroidota bacterium]